MTEETKATVLCVAAERLTLAVRGLVLQAEGYEVISASTFEDAMRMATTRHPDLIICDQNLGKESSVALADCLKQLIPETPILLITGVMESTPQTLAVDAVMTKIDGPEVFLENVASLLESPPGTRSAA
jgi:CheY-like chemotaxis protein